MRPSPPLRPAAVLLVLVLLVAGCGGEATPEEPVTPTGLTAAQLEHGVGPVGELTLGPVDPALAAEGAEVFAMKCSACHKLAERYVGPPLGDVVTRRSPGFVMNMMLNPDEMLQKHPVVREMLGQYMTPMPNQSLTEAEARAVLEYLRQAAAAAP